MTRIQVRKKRSKEEIEAGIARFRAREAAMNALSKDEQIAVLEEAMLSGSLPVKADISFN